MHTTTTTIAQSSLLRHLIRLHTWVAAPCCTTWQMACQTIATQTALSLSARPLALIPRRCRLQTPACRLHCIVGMTIKCEGTNTEQVRHAAQRARLYSWTAVCGGVAMRKSAKLSLFVDNFQTVNVVYKEVLWWLFVIICMSLSISSDVWHIFSV